MFGTANQLLAVVALSVATSAIINAGKQRYVWVTLVPMLFVASTTLTAGWLNITDNFLPAMRQTGKEFQGLVNITTTVIMMICAVTVLVEAGRHWYRVLVKGEYRKEGQSVSADEAKSSPPTYGCC
jgi:carbon starvation protein